MEYNKTCRVWFKNGTSVYFEGVCHFEFDNLMTNIQFNYLEKETGANRVGFFTVDDIAGFEWER
ncbi:hypothetical protein [Listeria seeligeri]|uniref:hypothetical protein n=1 Tax=Listeria seeligeri TaxID=1640 RepID=UPI001623E3B1|nr:hypothetical protein [Listeria seeligeri]MBC1817242.1 hypothetical protein [Listeria seeligeri]